MSAIEPGEEVRLYYGKTEQHSLIAIGLSIREERKVFAIEDEIDQERGKELSSSVALQDLAEKQFRQVFSHIATEELDKAISQMNTEMMVQLIRRVMGQLKPEEEKKFESPR